MLNFLVMLWVLGEVRYGPGANFSLKLALKMANVKKLIHLLSLAVILFSIIEFSNSNIFNAPCKDGFYAKKDDKNNKTLC
ncbi:hypothetical protein PV328_008148, partial [Microctonus aethiopoides]